jgi:hypothetical protein
VTKDSRIPPRLLRPTAVLVGLLAGIQIAAADPESTKSESEITALKSQVAALQARGAVRERTLRDLETRDAELDAKIATFRDTVAVPAGNVPVRHAAVGSPSSTADWNSALRAATAATLMVPGAKLITVMPTGSMEPIFNERALLLLEPARFEDLNIGDIVTYRSPYHGIVVVHRILEKRGRNFWAKGDNNGRMDPVYITRENYQARVFGIIYAREPSEQARWFALNLASK